MQSNDSFCWAKRNGEILDQDIWSSIEKRWIPGKGLCKVVSLSNGVLTYTIDDDGPYNVSLKEAIIQSNALHYPVDYVYPTYIK